MSSIVFYVSGHGFGHASRTVEVVNGVGTRAPGLRLQIRSNVAPWLVRATARPGVELAPVVCDTGAVQFDSLSLDEHETIRAATAFMETFPRRVEEEAAALRAAGARLVVADAPPLGIAAAKAAGLPAVLLGNFTWDWIYAAYPGGQAVADAIGTAYGQADLALRLPLHGGFSTCRRIHDLPFVARRSRRTGPEVRAALGFPSDRPLALVSFGGYGVDGLDLQALAATPGWGIVLSMSTAIGGTTLGDRGGYGSLVALDEPAMYARGYRYEDVVRAVDVVVTKPGYGIISECIANDSALLYTSRGHFAEYDVLVAGMPQYLRCRFVDQATLRSGDWAPALDALMAQPPPPERADVSGAEVAATSLLEWSV